MMRTGMTLFGTIMQAAVVLAGVSAATAQETRPVRIGVLTDMSGQFAENTGPGSVLAARMAVQDWGGSVLGRPVEVIAADHQNKPDVGSAIAREWFDRDGVDVVTELINSAVALSVMQVAREKDRISIVLGSGSTRITNEACTATNIQYAYDAYALGSTLVHALMAERRDSWFFVTADYAFGLSTEADMSAQVRAAGGTVVGAVRHPIGAADFASYLLSAQASGAKVVALVNGGADTVNAVKQAGEFGLTASQSLVGATMVINDVESLGLSTAQGMYLAEPFYWNRDEGSRAFARRFFAERKRMPNMAQAGMYSAVRHYLRAVAAVGSTDTAAVMAKMRETPVDDFFAPGGHIRADGLMVHDMLLLQVKRPAESHEPWDDLQIREVVPGEQAFAPLSASRCPMVRQP